MAIHAMYYMHSVKKGYVFRDVYVREEQKECKEKMGQ